jgi:hypothetical protein
VLPQVAQTVGVYYASNAVGRLVGTLASGALYSYVGSSIVDGFGACLMVSVAFAAASCAIDFWLHEEDAAPGVHRLGRLGACLPGRKQEAAAPVAQPPAAEATTP